MVVGQCWDRERPGGMTGEVGKLEREVRPGLKYGKEC